MPKVTYDLTDIDDLPDGLQAPVGTYIGKIEECEAGDSSKGNPMLTVRWKLIADATGAKIKEDYSPVWDYPILKHDSKFVMGKTKAFLLAIGVPLKGSIDPAKMVGKKALLKLKSDTDDAGDYRPRIGKVLPVSEADAGSQEEPEEVETEPEAEPEGDAVDLDAMDRDELKKFIRSEGLGTLKDLGITAKTTDDEIRDLIADKMGGEAEPEAEPEEAEPEPEPEEEPEPEDDGVDLDSLDRDALKKFIKDEKLGTLADLGINKATTDEQIREIIQTAMGGEPEAEPEPDEPEAEPEAEPDGEPEGDGYDAMDVKALAADVKERSIDVDEKTKKLRGAKLKAALIALLRADDAESPF